MSQPMLRPALSTLPLPVLFNVALRGAMELGLVLALAYWGYHAGETRLTRFLLATAAPLLVFGFWGAVDFHQLGSAAEAVRLVQELALTALAAYALHVAGRPRAAWALAGVTALHHVLVYALGRRLLVG